jgi:glycosyltransferase involved in cell wall biosynthesis
MKISVLMPTYNCPSDLLVKSLTSVTSQLYSDFEIIIKDGDIHRPAIANPAIASILENLGEKAKYINSPDGPPADESGAFGHNGFYEALNQCVRESTGDILCLLCSDDERGDAGTLSYVNDEFERHGPTPFCLYGMCEWINRQGEHIAFKQPHTIPITYENIICDYPFYTPSIFWNRAVHDKFGLFDLNYWWCADFEFWLRVWRGIDSKFAPRVIGKYRIWETSQARENGPLLSNEGLRILKKYKEMK